MCESSLCSVTYHSVTTPEGERRPTPEGSENHLLPSGAIWRKLGEAPEGTGYSTTTPVSGSSRPTAAFPPSVNQTKPPASLTMLGEAPLGSAYSVVTCAPTTRAIFPAPVSV